VRLGLRENLAQFSLLVVVNAFVGAMVGMERSILPPIAEQEFHLAAKTAVLSFIVVFGVTKALTNYLAGRLADRFGRKHVLVAGWIVAAPVPFLLMWAPTWSWVLAANALLGVSQGLTWSTTVIMKIDLAGAKDRGLAMGLNEFAGYFAVAGSALATGYIAARYGLRPEPFYLGIGFVAVGLFLSAVLVRDTQYHVAAESKLHGELSPAATPTQREIFWRTTLTDRNLSSVSQAGLVNNLNDGMAWGLFPLFFVAARMNLEQVGTLAAIYPATWGVMQLFTGAWSDRVGRKWLIAAGMWVQAAGIGVVVLADGFAGFASGAALLGVGTAMVYPTLLAAIGDVAHPSWRASSVGVYRLWRDLGYAVGALLAGVTADAFGLPAAMWVIAALTFGSGIVVALRMTETLRRTPTSIVQSSESMCIEPIELTAIMSRGRVLILDVRTAQEFALGHVEGAVNIPLDTIGSHASSLPRDRLLVTVCGKGGGRSDRAAQELRARGFGSVRPLCGGTDGWQKYTAQGA
jgi:MFS family permease